MQMHSAKILFFFVITLRPILNYSAEKAPFSPSEAAEITAQKLDEVWSFTNNLVILSQNIRGLRRKLIDSKKTLPFISNPELKRIKRNIVALYKNLPNPISKTYDYSVPYNKSLKDIQTLYTATKKLEDKDIEIDPGEKYYLAVLMTVSIRQLSHTPHRSKRWDCYIQDLNNNKKIAQNLQELFIPKCPFQEVLKILTTEKLINEIRTQAQNKKLIRLDPKEALKSLIPQETSKFHPKNLFNSGKSYIFSQWRKHTP